MKKYFISTIHEIYSKKKGMYQKSFLDKEKCFDTIEQTINNIKISYPEGKIRLNNDGKSGIIYQYNHNGIANHINFKITLRKIK